MSDMENTNSLEIYRSSTNERDLRGTYDSIGLIEEFIDLAESLEEYIKREKIKDNELQLINQKLKLLVEVLDTSDTPIKIIQNEKLRIKKLSKIERLGLGNQIIRQRQEQRMDIKDIAKFHNLSSVTVSRFFRYYDNSKPSVQNSLRKDESIFNTTRQLERLSIVIQSALSRLESDPLSHVAYVKEFRSLINDAAKLTEKQLEYVRYENFVQSVASILEGVLPEKKDIIEYKIKALLETTQSLNNF